MNQKTEKMPLKATCSCCSIFELIAASRQSWITSCRRKRFVLVTCSTINIQQMISAQYCADRIAVTSL